MNDYDCPEQDDTDEHPCPFCGAPESARRDPAGMLTACCRELQQQWEESE